MKPHWLLICCLCATAAAQQRYLVSPNNEVIPLKPAEQSARLIAASMAASAHTAVCGTTFTFGYTEEKFPANPYFGAHHKDVMAEWFVAPAGGTIDTLFWGMARSVGTLDSLLIVRVFKSNIYPGRGPGFGPYAAPCSPWGYYKNTNDSDMGISPFRDEATDTLWVSTVHADSSSFDPLGEELWGGAGYKQHVHAGGVNAIPLAAVGDTLKIRKGDPFFVTLGVNSPNAHTFDDPTEFAADGFRVTSDNENFPSRDWKFYEHDSGPSNCSGHDANSIPRGWVARGGFGDDSLDVAVFNIWYVMTVNTNTPPDVRSTDVQSSTFDRGPFPIEADIVDCNPANPPGGVMSAEIRWSLDNVSQAPLPMALEGGSLWQGEIPRVECGHTITYFVRAYDAEGETGNGTQYTFTVVCYDVPFYRIDTGLVCIRKDIAATGTTISPSSFFLPPTAPLSARAEDDGTAGPFDLGGSMRYFDDTLCYAWIGVNGAMVLTRNATDTVDVNANGFYQNTWNFPYLYQLRSGRDTSTELMAHMPMNLIAPLWDNFTLADSLGSRYGNIRYEALSGSDSCLFVVEWDSLGVYDSSLSGSTTKFRAVLNRCDGTIAFQYDDVDALDPAWLTGLQGPTNYNYVFINQAGAPDVTKPRDLWCVRLVRSDNPLSVQDQGMGTPSAFILYPNYPNPFNPATVMRFELPVSSHVTLTVFDLLGREIATVFDGLKPPGVYSIPWDGSRFPSGVYYYRLQAGTFISIRKAILMK